MSADFDGRRDQAAGGQLHGAAAEGGQQDAAGDGANAGDADPTEHGAREDAIEPEGGAEGLRGGAAAGGVRAVQRRGGDQEEAAEEAGGGEGGGV